MNSQIISQITTLDWIVFFLVLLSTFAAIIYGQFKKSKTSDSDEEDGLLDILLMGRKLTLPLFIATLVATWYGGIFGVTQIAYDYGVYNFLTQGVFWYFTYIFFAFFMVNRISKYQAVTLPDLMGKMFGPRAEKVSAIFNFFNVVPIAYAISLGLFLQALFGGNLTVMVFLGTLIVMAYSLTGGLRAVVFSDIVQFFVMCAGVVLVLFFAMGKYGGIGFLKANLPQAHFSPLGGNSIATTLVWGFIALSTLVDPNFYQRCFAAKSPKVAKKGILISTFVWFLFDICTTGGALYARAVMPGLPSDKAYLIFSTSILPSGLRGFVLAGFLATILSTLDSYLFIAGTTLSYDILPKKFRTKKMAHYCAVIFSGLLAAVLSTAFSGDIKAVWKTLGSYSASCLLFPVILGHLFPGKISDKQFVFTCSIGVVFTTIWRFLPEEGIVAAIDDLYIGIIATFCGLILSTAIRKKSSIFEG